MNAGYCVVPYRMKTKNFFAKKFNDDKYNYKDKQFFNKRSVHYKGVDAFFFIKSVLRIRIEEPVLFPSLLQIRDGFFAPGSGSATLGKCQFCH
jgi:hypothetical protein